MKRILLSLLLVLLAFSVKAMNYEDAREQAWFLTDKMAYELNLTPEQYDRAYQINLDYLMSLRTPSDCNGYYWTYRDADLHCILFDWQYNLYRTLTYFYHPVRWYQTRWYYPVFDRYRYGYYYFDCPNVYVTYRGGMWRRRSHNDPSPYIAMRPHRGSGMRDHYHNRDWFGGNLNGRPNHNSRPNFNNERPNHNNGRPNFNNGRPEYNGRPGYNGRPNNNNRPNTNNGRPSRPYNNGNNFRDEYTNYRQTGNSGQNGRGFGSGIGTPTNNRGNNNRMNNSNSGRSQRGTVNTPQGNRGGGRGLGK